MGRVPGTKGLFPSACEGSSILRVLGVGRVQGTTPCRARAEGTSWLDSHIALGLHNIFCDFMDRVSLYGMQIPLSRMQTIATEYII
jgi:hypothetical protein